MLDLKGAANVYLVLGLVVPGLLIVWARAQFITGRLQPVKDAAVAYLALSLVYYALAFPAVEYALTFERPGWPKAIALFAIVFLGPVLAGALLGMPPRLFLCKATTIAPVAVGSGIDGAHRSLNLALTDT